MAFLHKMIESFLVNIDHDFYAFRRFNDETVHKTGRNQKTGTFPANINKNVISFTCYPPQSDDGHIWNYPTEWTKLYVSQGCTNIDPVIAKLKRQFNPFIWGEGYFSPQDLDLEEKEQFIKKAQDFNLYKGISVPLGSYQKIEGALTIAFRKNQFIGDAAFFALSAHLRNLGNTILLFQDYIAGKVDISLEEYEELFRFLKDSNYSCTSIL